MASRTIWYVVLGIAAVIFVGLVSIQVYKAYSPPLAPVEKVVEVAKVVEVERPVVWTPRPVEVRVTVVMPTPFPTSTPALQPTSTPIDAESIVAAVLTRIPTQIPAPTIVPPTPTAEPAKELLVESGVAITAEQGITIAKEISGVVVPVVVPQVAIPVKVAAPPACPAPNQRRLGLYTNEPLLKATTALGTDGGCYNDGVIWVKATHWTGWLSRVAVARRDNGENARLYYIYVMHGWGMDTGTHNDGQGLPPGTLYYNANLDPNAPTKDAEAAVTHPVLGGPGWKNFRVWALGVDNEDSVYAIPVEAGMTPFPDPGGEYPTFYDVLKTLGYVE